MTKKRLLCSFDDLNTYRKVFQMTDTAYLEGSNSLYVMSQQLKLILKDSATKWADLEGEMVWMTPGEIARTELKREFPDLKRVGWRKSDMVLFDWVWPLHFSGIQPWGEYVYIDLKAAYWQIYRRLWLDVALPCGRGNLALNKVADRLETNKRARNSVIGLTRSNCIRVVKGKKWHKQYPTNPFMSPHLWATVQIILNEIATVALSYGCLYIATDCYFFRLDGNWWAFSRFLETYGLEYRRLTGPGEISGWSKYIIDTRQTVYYRKSMPAGNRPFTNVNLYRDKHEYLLTFWAERGNWNED